MGREPSRRRFAAGFVGVALVLLASRGEAAESKYTSIRNADCANDPADLRAAFETRTEAARGNERRRGRGGPELGVQECAAFGGWRLLLVSADPRSWFELWRAGEVWSGERAVVYDRPIGQFPSVAVAEKVEWRRDADGSWRALIFRVVAGEPEDGPGRISRLFVVRLESDSACLVGRAATNEEARALADGPASCRDADGPGGSGASP